MVLKLEYIKREISIRELDSSHELDSSLEEFLERSERLISSVDIFSSHINLLLNNTLILFRDEYWEGLDELNEELLLYLFNRFSNLNIKNVIKGYKGWDDNDALRYE